ncbi:hypothetical protein [Arthrobacter sp. LFS091]|uniref:hypothetical protein n=1 Tax=Arthrobacter sp. LFS091 TaxID=3229892 RepID=UPI003A7FF983
MAVVIYSNEDAELSRHNDDENGHHAYKILDSGVLQVLQGTGKANNDWSAIWEYGPGAWHKVQGTRFINETTRTPGADGSAPRRTGNENRMMVL